MLAALENYFDTREQFYDADEEGRSGVEWAQVLDAHETAVQALCDLARPHNSEGRS